MERKVPVFTTVHRTFACIWSVQTTNSSARSNERAASSGGGEKAAGTQSFSAADWTKLINTYTGEEKGRKAGDAASCASDALGGESGGEEIRLEEGLERGLLAFQKLLAIVLKQKHHGIADNKQVAALILHLKGMERKELAKYSAILEAEAEKREVRKNETVLRGFEVGVIDVGFGVYLSVGVEANSGR